MALIEDKYFTLLRLNIAFQELFKLSGAIFGVSIYLISPNVGAALMSVITMFTTMCGTILTAHCRLYTYSSLFSEYVARASFLETAVSSLNLSIFTAIV